MSPPRVFLCGEPGRGRALKPPRIAFDTRGREGVDGCRRQRRRPSSRRAGSPARLASRHRRASPSPELPWPPGSARAREAPRPASARASASKATRSASPLSRGRAAAPPAEPRPPPPEASRSTWRPPAPAAPSAGSPPGPHRRLAPQGTCRHCRSGRRSNTRARGQRATNLSVLSRNSTKRP